MGILPLRPDAVVATGPVTVTKGYPVPIVIEGLVSDSRGTLVIVRVKGAGPEDDGSPAMATIYRGVPNGSRLTIRTCDVSNSSFDRDLSRPEECVYGPLLLTERNSGVARFGMPRSGRGHIEFFDTYRSDSNGRQLEGDFGGRDYTTFLASLQPVDVPLVSVASGKLKPAHRLGDDQVRGGVRLRAWGALPAAGQLAVRVETVDVAHGDDVRFVSADDDARTYAFEQEVEHVLAAFGVNDGTGAAVPPVTLWEHVTGQSADSLRGEACSTHRLPESRSRRLGSR
ncbi:MAG: hypothetical protein IPG72_01005 [Ardenticatenales bacterium]|nr:hypothetical protein [Ardenticatenales bacterium]